MPPNLWPLFSVSYLILSGISVINTKVTAREIWPAINQYTPGKHPLQQVNSVSQLRDVFPGDWAFEALRSLVERYGCLAGYPDGIYGGNQTMSRHEFAAGLNACLNQIERLLQKNVAVLREDLETLKRLSKEFEGELFAAGTRINNLENRTAFLENHQFSTSTKLRAEIVFSADGPFGGKKADGSGENISDNLVLDDRVRLNFDTSFTGRDLLKLRLDALSTVPFGPQVTGTNMTRLAFQRNTDNLLDIGKLFYRFQMTPNLRFHVDAIGGRFNLNVDNFNSFFAHAVTGSISRFGRFNPIYAQGARGAGVTGVYDLTESMSLSLAYLARNPGDPNQDNGLFNGSYAALAQLGIKPTDEINLGLTYVRAYYPTGMAFVSGLTGSQLANAPFGRLPTSADQFGFQSSFHISQDFTLSGWVGVTEAHAEKNGIGFGRVRVNQNDDATIFNWAVTLAFRDLGKEGSLAGFVFGNPPRVTSNDSGPENNDTPWHLEGFYRYPITDNISINPGLLVVINPEGNSSNNAIYVGTIRTVFKF